jgi:uncharacterized protein (DUF58 family)
MGFRAPDSRLTNGLTKLEYGCYLAAALSYLMLRQQDAPGLLVFDEKVRAMIPPRGTRSHINNILKELDKTNPQSGTDRGWPFTNWQKE